MEIFSNEVTESKDNMVLIAQSRRPGEMPTLLLEEAFCNITELGTTSSGSSSSGQMSAGSMSSISRRRRTRMRMSTGRYGQGDDGLAPGCIVAASRPNSREHLVRVSARDQAGNVWVGECSIFASETPALLPGHDPMYPNASLQLNMPSLNNA